MSFLGFPRFHPTLLSPAWSASELWIFFIYKKHLDSELRSTQSRRGCNSGWAIHRRWEKIVSAPVSFNKTDLFLDNVTKQTYQRKQIPIKLTLFFLKKTLTRLVLTSFCKESFTSPSCRSPLNQKISLSKPTRESNGGQVVVLSDKQNPYSSIRHRAVTSHLPCRFLAIYNEPKKKEASWWGHAPIKYLDE